MVSSLETNPKNTPHHILVVDNHREDLEAYRRFLLSDNHTDTFTISAAESGEQGLQLVQERIPDCILLDSGWPTPTF